MVTKEQMLRAIQELPPEATVEDAVESLYLLAKVECGVAQAEAGQVVTHEEARRRMARWLR
jgi:predicted transcriptional regulator